MKAARFHSHGGLDVLQVDECEKPTAGQGEVLLKVKAVSLNHLDLFVRAGWPGLKLPLPHIGGTDVSGVVEAVGAGVEKSLLGGAFMVNPGLNFEEDQFGEQIVPPEPKILGETCGGGLAEYVVVPANSLIPIPARLTHNQAACVPLTLQTAMQMIRRAGVAAAQVDGIARAPAILRAISENQKPRVLIIGAGGGVSAMLIQLTKAMDCEVFVTCGGPEKVAYAKSLGATHAIDYKDGEWWKEAFKLSGKNGFDAVFDSVGASTWSGSIRCLAHGARLVTCGATTGPLGETNIQLIFWKQLQIIGSSMGTKGDLARGLEYVARGLVQPRIDGTYKLSQIREAQERMERGEMMGKIVVNP